MGVELLCQEALQKLKAVTKIQTVTCGGKAPERRLRTQVLAENPTGPPPPRRGGSQKAVNALQPKRTAPGRPVFILTVFL